jgi:hypothetical protein
MTDRRGSHLTTVLSATTYDVPSSSIPLRHKSHRQDETFSFWIANHGCRSGPAAISAVSRLFPRRVSSVAM